MPTHLEAVAEADQAGGWVVDKQQDVGAPKLGVCGDGVEPQQVLAHLGECHECA